MDPKILKVRLTASSSGWHMLGGLIMSYALVRFMAVRWQGPGTMLKFSRGKPLRRVRRLLKWATGTRHSRS